MPRVFTLNGKTWAKEGKDLAKMAQKQGLEPRAPHSWSWTLAMASFFFFLILPSCSSVHIVKDFNVCN